MIGLSQVRFGLQDLIQQRSSFAGGLTRHEASLAQFPDLAGLLEVQRAFPPACEIERSLPRAPVFPPPRSRWPLAVRSCASWRVRVSYGPNRKAPNSYTVLQPRCSSEADQD